MIKIFQNKKTLPNNYRKRAKLYTLFAVLLIMICIPTYYCWLKNQNKNITETPKVAETVNQTPPPEVPKKIEDKASAQLTVPYTVQAPGANWAVHEESCEEAAILMYHDYLVGRQTDIDPQTADREFRAQKAWQVKNWGAEKDLPLEQVGKLAKDYYGHDFKVIKNITAQDIKQAIAGGYPVLVPVLTQALKNPHYSPGNVYHILLIKGYDPSGVITNDAGVKEGKDWHYSWEILWQAIDAQTPKMQQGRNMVTLSK